METKIKNQINRNYKISLKCISGEDFSFQKYLKNILKTQDLSIWNNDKKAFEDYLKKALKNRIDTLMIDLIKE